MTLENSSAQKHLCRKIALECGITRSPSQCNAYAEPGIGGKFDPVLGKIFCSTLLKVTLYLQIDNFSRNRIFTSK